MPPIVKTGSTEADDKFKDAITWLCGCWGDTLASVYAA
jgi:hypothetical protein